MLIGCMLSPSSMTCVRWQNFIFNDEKAKIPLGLAAATLQASLLMHLEYKVKLTDHSFVVATHHKLNPSVYGICDVNLKGEVTYSGDTFIRIGNGKHDKSSAETHLTCMNSPGLNELHASQSF